MPITNLTLEAIADCGLNQALRPLKELFALKLVYWLFNRPLEHADLIDNKFKAKLPIVAEANQLALKAGYYFGETAEAHNYIVNQLHYPGKYRGISGTTRHPLASRGG